MVLSPRRVVKSRGVCNGSACEMAMQQQLLEQLILAETRFCKPLCWPVFSEVGTLTSGLDCCSAMLMKALEIQAPIVSSFQVLL